MAKAKQPTNRFKKSEALFKRAQLLMPGGVSSPVRSFQSVNLSPVFIRQGEGSRLTDVDSNVYIDYVMSYGPLILGHADPAVQAAVAKQMSRGSSFGCCTEEEILLAELITQYMPNVPMVRFVSSGTEAVMSAIRLTRAATGRSLIVKIAGGYHGHADAMLVGAGSGATTHGVPSSPGIPVEVTGNTLVIPFNDVDAARRVFAAHGDKIAGLFLELVMGNIGVVPPQPGYLQTLRTLCDDHKSLLVADEVMTGFRVARGGAQSLFDVKPDITCLGKIIGGGLPVGAYGGHPILMKQISPSGPVYQAGTLSGNPLAMAAGIVTLRHLESADSYQQLEALADRLQAGLNSVAAAAKLPLAVQRCGSMITPFFVHNAAAARTGIRNYADALACDTRKFAQFFRLMLEAGIMIPPSQFEAWFISLAHTQADIDATVEAAGRAMQAIAGEC